MGVWDRIFKRKKEEQAGATPTQSAPPKTYTPVQQENRRAFQSTADSVQGVMPKGTWTQEQNYDFKPVSRKVTTIGEGYISSGKSPTEKAKEREKNKADKSIDEFFSKDVSQWKTQDYDKVALSYLTDDEVQKKYDEMYKKDPAKAKQVKDYTTAYARDMVKKTILEQPENRKWASKEILDFGEGRTNEIPYGFFNEEQKKTFKEFSKAQEEIVKQETATNQAQEKEGKPGVFNRAYTVDQLKSLKSAKDSHILDDTFRNNSEVIKSLESAKNEGKKKAIMRFEDGQWVEVDIDKAINASKNYGDRIGLNNEIAGRVYASDGKNPGILGRLAQGKQAIDDTVGRGAQYGFNLLGVVNNPVNEGYSTFRDKTGIELGKILGAYRKETSPDEIALRDSTKAISDYKKQLADSKEVVKSRQKWLKEGKGYSFQNEEDRAQIDLNQSKIKELTKRMKAEQKNYESLVKRKESGDWQQHQSGLDVAKQEAYDIAHDGKIKNLLQGDTWKSTRKSALGGLKNTLNGHYLDNPDDITTGSEILKKEGFSDGFGTDAAGFTWDMFAGTLPYVGQAKKVADLGKAVGSTRKAARALDKNLTQIIDPVAQPDLYNLQKDLVGKMKKNGRVTEDDIAQFASDKKLNSAVNKEYQGKYDELVSQREDIALQKDRLANPEKYRVKPDTTPETITQDDLDTIMAGRTVSPNKLSLQNFLSDLGKTKNDVQGVKDIVSSDFPFMDLPTTIPKHMQKAAINKRNALTTVPSSSPNMVNRFSDDYNNLVTMAKNRGIDPTDESNMRRLYYSVNKEVPYEEMLRLKDTPNDAMQELLRQDQSTKAYGIFDDQHLNVPNGVAPFRNVPVDNPKFNRLFNASRTQDIRNEQARIDSLIKSTQKRIPEVEKAKLGVSQAEEQIAQAPDKFFQGLMKNDMRNGQNETNDLVKQALRNERYTKEEEDYLLRQEAKLDKNLQKNSSEWGKALQKDSLKDKHLNMIRETAMGPLERTTGLNMFGKEVIPAEVFSGIAKGTGLNKLGKLLNNNIVSNQFHKTFNKNHGIPQYMANSAHETNGQIAHEQKLSEEWFNGLKEQAGIKDKDFRAEGPREERKGAAYSWVQPDNYDRPEWFDKQITYPNHNTGETETKSVKEFLDDYSGASMRDKEYVKNMEQLPNYLQGKYRNNESTLSKFFGDEFAKGQNGYSVRDLFDKTKRLSNHVSKSNPDFIETMKKHPELDAIDNLEELLKNREANSIDFYNKQKFVDDMDNLFEMNPKLKNQWTQDYITDYVNPGANRNVNRGVMNALGRGVKATNSAWKNFTMNTTPATAMRNLYGGVGLNIMDMGLKNTLKNGVRGFAAHTLDQDVKIKPEQAFQMLQDMARRGEDLSSPVAQKLLDNRLDNQLYKDMASKYGGVEDGLMKSEYLQSGDLAKQPEKKTGVGRVLQSVNPYNRDEFLLTKPGQAMNSKAEQILRGSRFLGALDDYGTSARGLSRAGKAVRDTQFDYSSLGLTNREKALRDTAIPFFTFQKNMAQKGLNSAFTNPNGLRPWVDTIYRDFNQEEDPRDKASTGYQISGIDDQNLYRGMTPDGKANFSSMSWNPGADLRQWTDPTGKVDSSFAPLIKSAGTIGNYVGGGQTQMGSDFLMTQNAPVSKGMEDILSKIPGLKNSLEYRKGTDGERYATQNPLVNALLSTNIPQYTNLSSYMSAKDRDEREGVDQYADDKKNSLFWGVGNRAVDMNSAKNRWFYADNERAKNNFTDFTNLDKNDVQKLNVYSEVDPGTIGTLNGPSPWDALSGYHEELMNSEKALNSYNQYGGNWMYSPKSTYYDIYGNRPTYNQLGMLMDLGLTKKSAENLQFYQDERDLMEENRLKDQQLQPLFNRYNQEGVLPSFEDYLNYYNYDLTPMNGRPAQSNMTKLDKFLNKIGGR